MPFSVKKIKGIDTSNLEKLGNSVVDLAKYTEDEFSQVASALQGTEPDHVWNAPLPKPRRGTTIYADGAHWNPGSGEGPYWFDGATYHPMGQGSITDAPNDGNLYGRKSAAWAQVPVTVKTVKVQTFTVSGTYTPSAGMLYCIIECVGGGGGGGGALATSTSAFSGGGGGGGAYSRRLASAATVGVSQVVTVGGGGGGGAGNATGANGGLSSVGALCSAGGGSGGSQGNSAVVPIPGSGGVATIGDFIASGSAGQCGGYSSAIGTTNLLFCGGTGGSSIYGGGGRGGGPSLGNIAGGLAGSNFGGGGGGAAGQANGGAASGGAGAPGIVFVTEYCSQ